MKDGWRLVYLWVCGKEILEVSVENDISFLRAQSCCSIKRHVIRWHEFQGNESPLLFIPPSSLSFCGMHVKAGPGLSAPGNGMNSFHADNLENLMNLMENSQACFFQFASCTQAYRDTLTPKSFMEMENVEFGIAQVVAYCFDINDLEGKRNELFN